MILSINHIVENYQKTVYIAKLLTSTVNGDESTEEHKLRYDSEYTNKGRITGHPNVIWSIASVYTGWPYFIRPYVKDPTHIQTTTES